MRAGATPCEESSPSRIGNNSRIQRENGGVVRKATQKTTHFPIRMRSQAVVRFPRAVFGTWPREANPLPGSR
jgi:hypothetical protein